MAKFVEMDDRGVETWEDMYDGKLQVHYRQDVAPVLDYTKAIRNENAHDLGHDIWHYAHIPAVTILEMRFKHGVDIFKKEHEKRMFQLLNTEYPHLKNPTKTHTIKH
jgi:hypothetical protein